MIEATCIVDKEYEGLIWPHRFLALPRVGDTIESISSTPKETLQVLEVIHTSQWRVWPGATCMTNPVPHIKLRLGKNIEEIV